MINNFVWEIGSFQSKEGEVYLDKWCLKRRKWYAKKVRTSKIV